jgi:sugar lactone lactonase YvrE
MVLLQWAAGQDMGRKLAIALLVDGAAAAWLIAACGGAMDGDGPSPASRPCRDGACVSTVAGTGEFGTADGAVTAAQFFLPHAVAVDTSSQLHVADLGSNGGTRLIAGGQVSTLPEDAVAFPHPADVATDAAGNIYVADPYGNRILKVTASGATTVLAGTGQAGDEDGDGASASFSMPSGLAFDAAGTLYVADMGNRKIRKIILAAGGPG